jgi:D-glycero-D-manno-heptose 1,7-bisphosphate phosphatase
VRILADGTSVRPADRVAGALAGLAARGHEVAWLGGEPPAGAHVHPLAGLRQVRGPAPELVVSAGGPARAAWLAWRTRARAMLVDLGEVAPWGFADRLGWGVVTRFGLLEPGRAERGRELLPAAALEDVALWPEPSPEGAGGPAHADTGFLERAGERALARARGPRAWPALFLDRDGTLVVERGYLADPEGIELLPGVGAALRTLAGHGIALVVISNQAGVGRGRFPIEAAWATMARLRRALRAEGVELDAVRFCPHAPDAGCRCRKPGTLLLEEAAEDLHLSLAGSAMVGDRWLDAAAGRAAGGTGILVRTGYGREEEARIAAGTVPAPDRVMDDLAQVAAWAVERVESL